MKAFKILCQPKICPWATGHQLVTLNLGPMLPFSFASLPFIANLGEMGAQVDDLQAVQPLASAPHHLPPGLLQNVWALKVGEVEHWRWWDEGTVSFEGRSVLLGLSHVQGRALGVTTGH